MKYLTEDRIRRIVEDSMKKVLKEYQYSIQEPYYTLMDAINKFEEAFENDYDTTDGANNEVIASLEAARKKIDDFVRHPEGNGNTKMWDVLQQIKLLSKIIINNQTFSKQEQRKTQRKENKKFK